MSKNKYLQEMYKVTRQYSKYVLLNNIISTFAISFSVYRSSIGNTEMRLPDTSCRTTENSTEKIGIAWSRVIYSHSVRQIDKCPVVGTCCNVWEWAWWARISTKLRNGSRTRRLPHPDRYLALLMQDGRGISKHLKTIMYVMLLISSYHK